MSWIGEHTWVLSAWYAVSFLTAAVCLALHMHHPPTLFPRLVLVLIACLFGAMGAVLDGMQSGSDPLWPPRETLPWVYFAWSMAATLVVIECVIYLIYLRRGSDE